MALDPLLQALLPGFLEESSDIIDRISRDLFELERAAGRSGDLEAHYAGLARGLHTLKGSAGSLGLDDLAELAHRLEDLVAPARGSNAPMTGETADAILRALDRFKARLAAHMHEDIPPSMEDVLGEVDRLLGASRSRPPPRDGTADHARAKEIDHGRAIAEASDEDDEAAFAFRVEPQEIALLMRDVERFREVRLRLEERLRDLMTASMQLDRLGVAAGEARPTIARAARLLRADIDECDAVLDSFEERVRDIGMRPVRTLLDPLQRVARDLCRRTGKEARLSLVGGETSLDRRTLQAIRGALVQLLNNAIDHGIEPPDARELAGKHREGAVVIRVEQQGNMVFVELADDGAGLDLARIAEVAIERKVAAPSAVAHMKAGELRDLIFAPGFTTRREVTASSGRGAGMDVVREAIEALRGHVDVYSTPREGTRFVLTLPIDVGASPVIVVGAGEQDFAVPMLGVQRMISTSLSNVSYSENDRSVTVDEQPIVLRDLGALLGLRQAVDPVQGQPLMILESQGERVGIAVDRVVGERELVIRALPSEIGASPAFVGASTGAQGELVLVLKPSWLVAARPIDAVATRTRRALVVDDSLTARALHRAMLELGGFVVHTVGSAAAALERLQRTRYEVIVCDVAMEKIDGYELTRRVRARGELGDVPIVLVSAHDEGEERETARAAGADVFLGKRECAAGRLLAEVAALVARRPGEPPRSAPRSS